MKIYGQKTASKILGADKMIVSAINETELKKVFGAQGQYGSQNAIIFDVTTKAFYYLQTFANNIDAITVSNWLPVPAGDVEASEWTQSAYNKGSLVMKTQVDNSVIFYFSIMATAAGDIPGQSSKWFEIPTSSGTASIETQIEYVTLDRTLPLAAPQRTFTITANPQISINGTRIPMIQVLVRLANDTYEIAIPRMSINTTGGSVVITFTFEGDLSSLHNDSNNIIIQLL